MQYGKLVFRHYDLSGRESSAEDELEEGEIHTLLNG